MELGVVKWYGGYDRKRQRENQFGFIQNLRTGEDVFFHKSALRSDSGITKRWYLGFEKQLVGFDEEQGARKTGGIVAKNVCFAHELPAEVLQKTGLLSHPEVRKNLLLLRPELYLSNDPLEYFPYFRHESIRELFCRMHNEHQFGVSVADALVKYFTQTNRVEWSAVGWQVIASAGLTTDEMNRIIRAALGNRVSVEIPCATCPESWINDTEIVSYLNVQMLQSIKRYGWEPSEQQILTLLKHVTTVDVRRYLSAELSAYDAFVETIVHRGVRYLVHFTRLSNLKSILSRGIIPREELREENIAFAYSDEIRLDKREDYSCFSISYPNYRMLSACQRKARGCGDFYVVLLIGIELLKDIPRRNILLFQKNAATGCSTRDFLDDLFADRVHDRKRLNNADEWIVRTKQNLPDRYPTHPQAEIMMRGHINIRDSLRRVYVEFMEDSSALVGVVPIGAEIRVDERLFHYEQKQCWQEYQCMYRK